MMVAIAAVMAVLLAGAFFIGKQEIRVAEDGPPIHLTVGDFGGDRLGREMAVLVKDSFLNNMVVGLRRSDPEYVTEGDFVLRGDVSEMYDS